MTRIIFFSFMTLFTGLVIFGFYFHLNIGASGNLTNRIFLYFNIFDLFLAELLVLLIIIELFFYKYFILRIISYIFSSFFIILYLLQLLSIQESGIYISRLAIENSDHIYIFINRYVIFSIIFITIIYSLFIFYVEKTEKNIESNISYKYIFILSFLVILMAIFNNNNWFYNKSFKYNNKYFEYDLFKDNGPVSSFYNVIVDRYGLSKKISVTFTEGELKEIKKFGFHYDSTSRFPLIKETIYNGQSPFPVKHHMSDKPNIIVVFSEGISARSLGVYGAKFPDITPNIDDFAQSSMVVHNYYNHTAATYRGLLGQLCSLFPINGGNGWQTEYEDLKKNKYLSIAELFKERNYETIFLDSHHKRHVSRVDEMISKLGFMTVLTGDELSERYLGGAEPAGGKDAFSDKQFFNGFVGFLEERFEKKEKNRPFFLGIYNFGTHAFLKQEEDVVKYGNGENYVLNNIHSFDRAFGHFWAYFKKSPYSKNSIVIFTADHCHYPEKPFVKAFDDPNYQGFFFDKIPYILFDPTRILPKKYNVHNSTSLDFAPSLAHYLDFGNVRNSFLGTSMYEQNAKEYHDVGVGFIGDQKELFIINDQKIQRLGNNGDNHQRSATLLKFINATHQLELADRLWSKSTH